jgi:hypothetical protein
MYTTDVASSDTLDFMSSAPSELSLLDQPASERFNAASTWILHNASNLHDVKGFAQLLHV